MDINLKVEADVIDELTWEQWEVFTSGVENFSFQKARDVIAMFMVDDAGKPIPKDEAYTLLGKLKTHEMTGAIGQFTKAIKIFHSGNVNPTKGGG